MTAATTEDPPAPARARDASAFCERHFAWIVLGLIAAAAAVRVGVLREFWAENPFARFPILDGAFYWQRAGEIAAGASAPGEPFHVAPLYPHWLAALRLLGADAVVVATVQQGLHLLTAIVVAVAARLRFGSAAGCLAAGLFLALAEPALFATRLLGATLQLLLVALIWWDWAKLARADAPGSSLLLHLRIGLWIGLLALAFPAAMLLAPVFGAWSLRRALRDGSRRGFAPAAVSGVKRGPA